MSQPKDRSCSCWSHRSMWLCLSDNTDFRYYCSFPYKLITNDAFPVPKYGSHYLSCITIQFWTFLVVSKPLIPVYFLQWRSGSTSHLQSQYTPGNHDHIPGIAKIFCAYPLKAASLSLAAKLICENCITDRTKRLLPHWTIVTLHIGFFDIAHYTSEKKLTKVTFEMTLV